MVKDDEVLEELRRIRALLEPKPAPPEKPKPKGLWAEFIAFLSTYKVLGLAVAFILGMYLGNLVQALVKDFLMPLIGLIVPGMDNLATLSVAVGSQQFGVGDFLAALITFVIVAFVVFMVVKVAKKWGIE
ncbi:MAG: MscL family protein [Candidatus Bathyarchaeia archaeon]